jgi:excisionase family DNA binding protein
MSDPILTLPEVAVLLKVAEKTVYTMARNGQLPAFKVRGQCGSNVTMTVDRRAKGSESEHREGLMSEQLAKPIEFTLRVPRQALGT